MASSSSRQYQRPAWGPSTTTANSRVLCLLGQRRRGSHRRSPAGRVGRVWLAPTRPGVGARKQLALGGAVLARRAPRCLVHVAAPPHRLGPFPRVHRSSRVDLDRFGRRSGSDIEPRILMGELRRGLAPGHQQ